MSEISVGAVGAAIIAGLVSLLGLIIGKEQKVSEFRQAWIDDLRKCLVSYLVNINAISDLLRSKKPGSKIDDAALMERYRYLNEASHGITLRVNSDEVPAKELLASMKNFENLAGKNAGLTPDNIRSIELKFVESSKNLLKFEWNRVKRGEKVFVWTKYILSFLIFVMVSLFICIWIDLGEATKLTNDSSPVRSKSTDLTQHEVQKEMPVVAGR